jgi:hypothetical protein
VVICPLFVCVSGVPACVLSGRALHHHAPMVKPEAANAVVPSDDGRGGARNMLSHIQMSSKRLVKLLHLVG